MAKDIIHRGDIRPFCKSCGKRYDLRRASERADREGTRTVKCPHCNCKVGSSN
jgi:DNA-directed RNA polymerase subunit RPC12/RpoP